MLTNVFIRKPTNVQILLTLADQLGLSLRENVEFLTLNDSGRASFLTESKKVISGKVDFLNSNLEDITVFDAKIFEDKTLFDNLVTVKVKSLLSNILTNSSKASKSFDNILEAWESRYVFDKTLRKLEEKSANLETIKDATKTEEFERLNEVKSQLVAFLSLNKDELCKTKEVINSVVLGGIISEAFNLPKISINTIEESKQYKTSNGRFNALYQIVCKQELIKKELLENKTSVDELWANSDKVSRILDLIIRPNDKKLVEVLAEAINENPYLALASKKQLTSLLSNSIRLNEGSSVDDSSLRNLVAKLFELKKPVKKNLLSILNKNYGINEQIISSEPSFTDLAKTQKVLFETLSRLTPRKSVLKTTLKEFAEVVDISCGIGTIDVNNWILSTFVEAGYMDIIQETSLMSYLDFNRVAQDLQKIGGVLQMIQQGMGGGGGMQGPGMGQQLPPQGGSPLPGTSNPGQPVPPQGGMAGQFDDGGMGMQDQIDEPDGTEDLASMGAGGMDPNQAAMGAQEDASMEMDPSAQGGEDLMGDEEEDPMEDGAPEGMEQEELINQLRVLDSLISDLKADIGLEDDVDMEGLDDEGGEFGDEFGGEEGSDEFGGEESGEGGEINLDTGEGDDDVHVDLNSHDNPDEESEEGSDGEDSDDDGDMDEPKPKPKAKEKSKGKPFPPKK